MDRNIKNYYPTKVIVKGGHNTDYVVIGVMVLLVLIVWTILMYFTGVYFKTSSNKIYLGCAPGLCSTIVATGEKQCPVNPGDIVAYDPAYQVCNTKYGCEDAQIPYALQTDGSTNIMGTCEDGIICRCTKQASCPADVLVLFNMVGGTIYQENPDTSRVTFQQISLDNDSSTSNTYSNTASQFCAIKANHLNRVAPSACIYKNDNVITLYELKVCLNETQSCIFGQIAFYPQDFEKFILDKDHMNTIYDIPVACVPISNEVPPGHITNYCPPGLIPVFNKNIGKIVCVDVGYD